MPETVRTQARVLLGQTLWTRQGALEAVAWFASRGTATVGIERFERVGSIPRWTGASAYEYDADAGWAAYVESCAAGAREYLLGPEAAGGLFGLSTMRADDPRGIADGEPTGRGRSGGGTTLWDGLRRWFGR